MIVTPEVPLPSSLPLWKPVQELLLGLQKPDLTVDDLIENMKQISSICDLSDTTSPDPRGLETLRLIVETQFSADERTRFLSRTLPCMARYAISLKELKPKTKGFRFSLSDLHFTQNFDRRFVASVAANAFFSTLPGRMCKSTTLSIGERVSFKTLFGKLDSSLDQALRFRHFLNYFDVLDVEEPWGHVRVTRESNRGKKNLGDIGVQGLFFTIMNRPYVEKGNLDDRTNLTSDEEKPLAPIFVSHERRALDLQSAASSITFRHIPPLDHGAVEDVPRAVAICHPELILIYLFVEQILPHESLTVSGLLLMEQQRSGGFTRLGNHVEAACLVSGPNVVEISNKAIFMREMELLGKSFKSDARMTAAKSARSSTVSSKTSELDRLAKRLSRVSDEGSGDLIIDNVQEDKLATKDDGEEKTPKDYTKRKSRFADRLKMAMMRGDTPDSELLGAAKVRPVTETVENINPDATQAVDRFSTSPPTESEGDNNSTDDSFSFELDIGDLDDEYEQIVLNITEKEVTTSDRSRAVKSLTQRSHRRGLSESYLDAALTLDVQPMIGINPHVVSSSKFSKSSYARRSISCQIDDAMAVSRKTNLNDCLQKYFHLESEDDFPPERPLEEQQYAWVASPSLDPSHFMTMWLAASLADVPLLVFQCPKEEEDTLERIFGLCSKLERKGWSARNVLDGMLGYVQRKEDCEDDLFKFLARAMELHEDDEHAHAEVI